MAELMYRDDRGTAVLTGGHCVAVPTVAGSTVYLYAVEGEMVASDSEPTAEELSPPEPEKPAEPEAPADPDNANLEGDESA